MAFLDKLKLYKISDIFPIHWTRQPENPYFRYGGYDYFHTREPVPNGLRDALWTRFPSTAKFVTDQTYWRDTLPPLSEGDRDFWVTQTGIKDEKELRRHISDIRDEAWQVIQEFTIARWWFLRSIMTANPYYSTILERARGGATIIDLGCGLGQELRHLRADGATGELYGVDCKPEAWDLGSRLSEGAAEDDKLHFRKADIVWNDEENQNQNPLAEFAEKADIYLLNDVLSFRSGKIFNNVTKSIFSASKVGTMVQGWMVGQVGEATENDAREIGDGHRGYVLTLDNFKKWFRDGHNVGDWSNIKWDVKAELVDFEKLGFDQEDLKWFQSDFWNGLDPKTRPNELKAICFLATRTA